MLYPLVLQIGREEFVVFYRDGADENRLALLVELSNFFSYRFHLAGMGLKNQVAMIRASHWLVSRYDESL